MENDEIKQDVDLENDKVVEPEGEEVADEVSEEDKTDYRGKLNANNRFLEKEGYKFKEGRWVKPEVKTEKKESSKEDALSTKDLFALTKSNTHEDDVDWIVKQAKLAEKTIPEFLKDEEAQAVLKLRTEKRATANASNIKPARQGNQKTEGASLIKELKSGGKLPEPGSEEAEALFWARRGKKK